MRQPVMRSSLHALAGLALAGLAAACSVPSVTFTGEVDSSGVDTVTTHVDAMPGAVDIKVQPTSLTITEGTSQTFMVTLSGQPATAVLVTATSSDDTKLGLSGATMLFNPSDWNQARVVMASGKQDPDTSDESETITVASTSAAVANGATIPVTVIDDDKLALKVSPSTLDVSENASAPLMVHLTAQPTADVTVNVSSDNLAAATVTPATLTFTSTNYAIDQTVTVSGVKDANTVTDTANVVLGSTALTTVQVPVSVADIDVLGIAPSTTSISMKEGDTTTFTVALTQQPAGIVSVDIATSKSAAVTTTPTTLTFTPATWSQAQTVVVNALQDPDTQDEAVSLTLSSTGLASRTVAVAVTDDDVQALVVTPASVTMNENGTATVGVHLAFKPAADETIAVTSLDTTVVTVTPAQLIFSPSSYGADQNLTLSAPDDLDAVDNNTTLHLASTTDPLATDVPVLVHDDDTLGIDVSTAAITLNEGATGTFQVRLTAKPLVDTQVAVVSTNVAAATVSAGALTFTSANWNVYQTVTVSGVPDVNTADEHVEIDLTATGMAPKSLTANVIDTTALGLTLTPSTLTVTEGSSGTFTVVLSAQPPANVDVTVATADSAVATASPATLTFTTTNWQTPQVVTVLGTKDANAVDDTTTISLSATGLTTRTESVTVKDTDVLGIEANPASLTVGEGATGTIALRLTAQPAADTTVTVASSRMDKATVAPTSLVFTTANWNSYQNVIVTGVQDPDAVDESLTITASGTGLATASIPTTVIDDEVLGIVVDTPSVSLLEGGTATFHAHLAAAPTMDTMVTVTSSDTGAATAAPAVLTFTTANWATDQTVTVTGVQDLDLANESVTITLAAAGFPNRLVAAAVTDDDTQIVVASTANLSVTEGTTNTIGVTLGFQPAANVVVSIASADPTVATVAPASLTFTPANYNVAQNVTVTGAIDANAVTNNTTLTLSAPSATAASVAVTVPDVDTLGLTTSTPAMTISETGNGTFGVHLTAQPTASTSVTVTSGDTTAATVAPATLTFTPANWNVDQTVTVTGVRDPDAVDAHLNVTVASAGLTSVQVAVTVTDVDVLGIATSAPTVALVEGGTGTFGVKLTAKPQSNVTVAVASPDTGAATVAPATLTFTPANYATLQTVTVTGVQDQDVANESVALALTASGLATVNVTANVTDDDVEQILLSSGTLTTSEGATATVGVTLRFIPSGNVTVTIASSDTTTATVSPTTMVFSAANYNVSQTLTVTGVQDPNAVPNNATVSLTSPDATAASLAVTVNDNDTLAIKPSPAMTSVIEGQTATYTVVLTAQPTATTTVNLASANPAAATASPASLVFTTANWNSPQTVTVTGVQDLNLTNESTSIAMSATGLTTVNQPVTVTDDDTQTIVASTSSLSVNESASTTYTVALQFIPATNVTVNLASTNTAVATVAPASMVFTPANYATPQTVTVTGVHDANTVTDNTTVTATATGANAATVNVAVNDIDVLGITTDVSALSIPESATGTINVKLNAAPTGNVTVNVASLGTGVATVSPATLSFSTADWNTYKPVTVTGVHDNNLVDDVTTVKLSATGMSDVNVPVTVTDRDMQTVLVSPTTPLGLNEGQTGSVGVSLQYQPAANVTVTVASGNTAVATASAATLTFTPANYNTAQSVTITAIHDADAVNNSTTVSFTAPGANSASTTVNVTDLDTLGIALNPAPPMTLSVGEGGTATFTVVLTAQPLTNATVSVVSTNPAAATVSVPSLTFTPGTWNQPQTVTVSGVQDPNTVNENLSINLTATGMASQSLGVTTIDDDVQTILVSSPGTGVSVLDNGAGNSTTVGVTLAYQPAANVTVTVASAQPGVATVAPATLTFTPANYTTAQNITITGVHDVNTVDDSSTINLTAPAAIGATIPVTVRDTDQLTLVTSVTALNVNEGGTNVFRVHLSNQPQGAVSVGLASDNGAAAVPSPAGLTFDGSTWATDQLITVTGVQDINLTNETAKIVLSSASTPSTSVVVTVIDDDTQALLVTPSAMVMNEASSGSVQVSLAFQPSANVTVNLASSNQGNLNLGTTVLTFTPANYNLPQSAGVTATADGNTIDDPYTITVSSAGVPTVTIPVTVVDRNLISPNPTSTAACILDLPGTDSITIQLNDSPITPLTLTITGNARIKNINPNTVTFDSTNYSQPVTIYFDPAQAGNGLLTIQGPGQATVTVAVFIASAVNC